MALARMMTQENPLERFTILRELGRGAIGTVHAARDRSRGSVVALKTLDPALFSEPNSKLAQLFLENARSAARLRHRNIIRVFDAGEAGGTAYVAMELVEGESLRQILDERALPIARAIQIFDDVASALAYAHEEQMVHRGVKPTNIMVSRPGVAKIGDFGTGQIGEAALRYTSPEQVRREPVDHRSDLFSLGAVFYEMLTRRAPFEGTSPEQIRQNILNAEPPPPSSVNPHVPAAIDAIVLRMLAKRPDERFANARLVLRELQRLEEGFGLRPAASAATAEPAASVPPRAPEVPPRAPEAAPRAQEAAPRAPDAMPRTSHLIALPTEREPRLPTPAGEAFYADARYIKDPEPRPEPPRASGASFLAALALMLAVLSIGLTVVLNYSPDTIERLTRAIRTHEALERAAPPPPATAPAPVSEAVKEPAAPPPAAAAAAPPPAKADAKAEEPSRTASAPAAVPPPPPLPIVKEPSPSTTEESAPAPDEPAKSATAAPQEAPRAAQPTARAAQPTARVAQAKPVGTAKLILAVSPQGELYIDGEHLGTTPPLTTLDLEPGMHRIEIRSGSRKPYLTYMTVSAGEERRIRHDFAAKPIAPPR